jgi:hypothetical protein
LREEGTLAAAMGAAVDDVLRARAQRGEATMACATMIGQQDPASGGWDMPPFRAADGRDY